jgi:hypothetical protein
MTYVVFELPFKRISKIILQRRSTTVRGDTITPPFNQRRNS